METKTQALLWIILFVLFIALFIAGIVMITKMGKKQSKLENYNFDQKIITSYHDVYNDVSGLQYNISNNFHRNNILTQHSIESPPPAPQQSDIDAVRKEVNDWYNEAEKNGALKSMDFWAKISIEAALDAASIGNWPIGNVICWMPPGTENDPTKWIEILRGGNRFFTRNPNDILSIKDTVPRFDSHAHGEMVVLDAFESNLSNGFYDKTSVNYKYDNNSLIDFRKRNEIVGYGMPDNIVLFTQLNSCQMCLSRIGNAGISACYWVAPDTAGGLAHKLCDSVPAYFNMLNRQIHAVADCSQKMIEFAFKAFAGPDYKWVTYCTWKLGILSAPKNLTNDYGYCKGQYYANTSVGQNTEYDPGGFFRTVDQKGGPKLEIQVIPP